MKKLFGIALFILLGLSVVRADEAQKLREGFRTPPYGGGAQTWWHWTSLFVTKEGITADLESMKEIGYEAAHIFSTSSSGYPKGDYPEILSPEWLDLMLYAGEEAQRLGLHLGVHNCPGWSLSGGPWIKPEDAMQMLVSSELNVSAATKGPIALPQPEIRNDYYRDVAVLAFPDVNRHEPPRMVADFTGPNLGNLLDDDNESYIRIPIKEEGSQAVITMEYDTPYSPQFLELTFGEVHLFVKGIVEASTDGKSYTEVADFDYKIRTDMRLPKAIRLGQAATGARYFRVTFMYRPYRWWMKPVDVRLNRMRLLASSMVTDVDTRNSTMEDSYSYKPFAADYTTPGVLPTEVLDLTDRLRPDGTLDWVVPAGHWTILRIGHTPTGKENGPSHYRGLECDKLSRRGLNAHWPEMMGKIIETLRPTGALKYAIVDSYEAGGQNWTADFEEQFLERRGYALRPYLPAVVGFVVGTPQQSARFLYDFQRTISELFAENYYDYFAELCHQNGLMAITESYFGPFDYLRCARMADINTGEFWVGSGTEISRMPGSSSHFHGRKRVAAESFTTGVEDGRWQQDPWQLKEYGDRAWVQGVTQIVMHSFVHQPYVNVRPGMTLGRHGSHLSRTNTWWKYGDGWVDYINRSQWMLQMGRPVADLLVLSGESAPNNFPKDEPFLKAGYNYDYCCVDDLWEFVRVENGRLVTPSGMNYTALSLGPDRYLTLKTLHKVYHLLQQGATVAGVRPLGSPSLSDNDAEWSALVEKIWGTLQPGEIRSLGAGRLVNCAEYLPTMQLLEIAPDMTLEDRVEGLHRQEGDLDVYFLYNDSTRTVTQEARFRIPEGRTPEFWHADDARTEPVAVWYRDGAEVVIPMTMVPRESLFVVFAPGEATHLLAMSASREDAVTAQVIDGETRWLFSQSAEAAVITSNGKEKSVVVKEVPAPIDLSRAWRVEFTPDLGAPAAIEMDELQPWDEHSDEGVKYFSGTAFYKRTFTLPKGWNKASRRVVLDLGTVKNLAEVTINGEKVALLWKEPFVIDLTDALRAGENQVEIAVTNLWVNRLIGDARNTTPVAETDGWPNWVLADQPNSGEGHYTYAAWKGWGPDEPLKPSGLIGPVTLRCIEVR